MGLTVLDAGVVIGFLDRNDAHHDPAHEALSQAIDRHDRVVLPASAYAECLVGPFRRGVAAVRIVREVIERVPVEIVALDPAIAEDAAQLRAAHRALRLPDALVIATARVLDADRLVSTDRGWPNAGRLGLRGPVVLL